MGTGYSSITSPINDRDLFESVRSESETWGVFQARVLLAADPERLKEVRFETLDHESDELTLQAAIVHDSLDTLNPEPMQSPNGLDNLTVEWDEVDVSREAVEQFVAEANGNKVIADGGEK